MVYNVRAPEQWEIIFQQIDFQGKTVLDLGCGKGDILSFASEAGAHVIGIDNDKVNIEYIRNTYPKTSIIEGDIDCLTQVGQMDIIICFSVLPYLAYPKRALHWINFNSEVALIECQYAGDGPGLHFLTNNDDMKEWLLVAGQFKKVEVIGHTVVEGRDKRRYIWMCE